MFVLQQPSYSGHADLFHGGLQIDFKRIHKLADLRLRFYEYEYVW